MHAGVVGYREDESSLDRDEGGVDEGVGGHVEPDVFHRDEDPPPGEGGTQGFLVGGLLIRAPSRAGTLPGLVEPDKVLEDLGRRGARIAVGRAQARMDGSEGYCLVGQEDDIIRFHGTTSLSK